MRWCSDFVRETLWQGLLVGDATPQLKGLHQNESSAADPFGEEDPLFVVRAPGEVSVVEAAGREKVSEQAIGNWKR